MIADGSKRKRGQNRIRDYSSRFEVRKILHAVYHMSSTMMMIRGVCLFKLVVCSQAFTSPLVRSGGYRPSQAAASTLKEAEEVALPKASLLDKVVNGFQVWALRRPRNVVTKLLLPVVSIVESNRANSHEYYQRKRAVLGPNYCSAGQVVLGEFSELEKALTEPQARTNCLGASYMNRKYLPVKDRLLFLLALSQQEAGGNGDWEAGRKCVEDNLTNDAALQRQKDPTAQKLLQQLAKDYAEMDHSVGGAFFTERDRGLTRFNVRYIHYVTLGLDPDDETVIAPLTELYVDTFGILRYFSVFGNIAYWTNLLGARKWPKLFDEVASIYDASPALSTFKEDVPEYRGISKKDFATMIMPLIGIAALAGPLSILNTAMGGNPLPPYRGHDLTKMDVTQYWDQVDLDDRTAVEKYVFECGRLETPVFGSHRVATEPFTTTIRNRKVTFPEGTIIFIPLCLGMLDEDFWGPTTYEFDDNRENLCPFSMMFNSVGSRTNGRICPGRDIALNTVVDVVTELGKVRRRASVKE